MLVPAPDTSTAPFALACPVSGKMPGFPRFSGGPGFRCPANGAAARSIDDFANAPGGLSVRLEICSDLARHFGRHRQNHPDPAVEGTRHLAGFDVALRLEEGHQTCLFPRVGVD